MTPDLRRLTAADVEAYRGLFLAGLDREPDAFIMTREEAIALPVEGVRERLDEGWIFGAFEGPELVAIVGGRRPALARLGHRMEVGPVYVAPHARRRGLARRLIETLAEAARAAGLLQLELNVSATNPAALGLYERIGFVRTGLVPRSVRTEDGFEDDITMAWRLD